MVANGQKQGGLYMVEVSADEAHVVEEVVASNLWHQRIGHRMKK